VRLGLVVNDISTEKAFYSTTRLAVTALARDHEVWTIPVADFQYGPDTRVRALARTVPRTNYKSSEAYLKALQSPQARTERISVDDFDVILLRNDPAGEIEKRDWAKRGALVFARLCMEAGVIVLNDPNGLAKAETKLYLEQFPEQIRPKTLVSRHRDEIRDFCAKQGTAVLKPLVGSGGNNVFVVHGDELANLNQMIDAVSRDGFVIAQEYLEEATQGEIRLFMMNGQPLRYKGKYCAFRRSGSHTDEHSHVQAGAVIEKAELDKRAFEVAEIVRPKLVEDGMFLVGIDLVGDKLMEINAFTPGGLGNAQKFEGVNFAQAVVQALERKVQYAQFYQRKFNNVDMATL